MLWVLIRSALARQYPQHLYLHGEKKKNINTICWKKQQNKQQHIIWSYDASKCYFSLLQKAPMSIIT